MRGRKGVKLDGKRDGEELGGVEQGDTAVRIYNTKKKNLVSLK